MGTLRRISTGEIVARTPSAPEAAPRGSKRRIAERQSAGAVRVLPEAGADDNSAWGQKVRDAQGMLKRPDQKAAAAPAKGGLSGGANVRTAQSEIRRLQEEAASPASYLGPSFAQNRRYRQVKELQKSSGAYSLGTSIKGMVEKGLEQIATAGGDTLALGEDILLAPIEVLSGMRLGDLSDTAPANTWARSIRREAEAVNRKYQANMEKGGTPARLLEEYGASTVAAVPRAAAAMLTGGASAAAQTTAGLTRTAAAELYPGVSATVSRAAGAMAKNPLYWSSFARTVGGDYENALRDQRELEAKRAADATARGTPYRMPSENTLRTKAALYAIGSGLLNAAVEAGGGIETLPGELHGRRRAWKAYVDTMVDEGGEEVVQGIIQRALKGPVYGAGTPLFSTTDENAILNPVTAAKEFAGGAVVGGVLGGAQMGIANAAQRLYGREKVTVVGYSPIEAKSIQKEGKTYRNLVAGFDTKVSDFFVKWKDGRNHLQGEKLEKLYLGKLSDRTTQKISDILGYNVGERDVIVTADDVKHIIDEHGDTKEEINRGNLPLEDWALNALPEVVINPDYILRGKTLKGGKHPGKTGIIFSKSFTDGTVITIQFDNKGRSTMEITTVYVNKSSGNPTQALDVENNFPQLTSETVPGPAGPAADALLDGGRPPFSAASSGVSSSASSGGTIAPAPTVTGPENLVKFGFVTQIDGVGPGTVEDAPADVARLYQQLLAEANKAKRIEALEQYYRKYVGEASGEGTESEISAAFPELERAYREAMGTERYDDETFRELKRLYEEYVGNPMEKPEDEERDPDWS